MTTRDEIVGAIDQRKTVADVANRLRGTAETEIVADVGAGPYSSRVFVDGLEITNLLRGFSVSAGVDALPEVVFTVAGAAASKRIRAVVPQASIVVVDDAGAVALALAQAFAAVGATPRTDMLALAQRMLDYLLDRRQA